MHEQATHLGIWFLAVVVRSLTVILFISIAYGLAEKVSDRSAKFWIGVVSDGPDPSWARMASSALLVSCIAWNTIYLLRTGQMVDAGTFVAEAAFIAFPYSINVAGKAASMIATSSGKTTSTHTEKVEATVSTTDKK